jgi:O-antigen ligase
MWLGGFCGALYLLWVWRPWAILAAPCALALLLLANPFGFRERAASAFAPKAKRDSNDHREELRKIGLKMIADHPWLGVGPEQVRSQTPNYLPEGERTPLPGEYYGHLENDYLQYAAERGIPTMLALMWLIGWALFDFIRTLRGLPPDAEERWILHSAVAVTLAVLVSGFYSWNLNASSLLAMFLAVLGCGYVIVLQRDRRLRAD